MAKSDFKVDWEPMFRTREGPLKPDLVVSKENYAYVIDVAICSDRIDPEKV